MIAILNSIRETRKKMHAYCRVRVSKAAYENQNARGGNSEPVTEQSFHADVMEAFPSIGTGEVAGLVDKAYQLGQSCSEIVPKKDEHENFQLDSPAFD